MDLRLCLPSESQFVPVLRAVASDFLRRLGVRDDDVADVELALSEACANVVRHAGDTGEYDVVVKVDTQGCTILVEDAGPGFDPTEVRPAGQRAEHGRGLELIGAVVDSVSFTRDIEGHTVRMRKEFQQPVTPPER